MPFDINVFKENLTYGGARPSLFEVTLTFPTIVINSGAEKDGVTGTEPSKTTSAASQLTFLCKASSIPSSTVAPIEVPYFGRKVKFAGNRTFPEWTITVINDENFVVRNAFEQWLAGINTHKTNLHKFSSNSKGVLEGSYQSQGTVKQYSKTGGGAIGLTEGDSTAKPSRIYNFANVFPSEISPIELNWGSENEIEEFTVTLQYDYWYVAAQ